MKQVQSLIAVLCVLLLAAPGRLRAGFRAHADGANGEHPAPLVFAFTHKYQWREAPSVNVSNSGRIDALMRAGQLYLSLNEAISLSLENNIDSKFSATISPWRIRTCIAPARDHRFAAYRRARGWWAAAAVHWDRRAAALRRSSARIRC